MTTQRQDDSDFEFLQVEEQKVHGTVSSKKKPSKRINVNYESSLSLETKQQQEHDNENDEREQKEKYWTFILNSRTVLNLFFLCFLLSFSLGTTAGLVPVEVTDRFARMNHFHEGPHCSSYHEQHKQQNQYLHKNNNDAEKQKSFIAQGELKPDACKKGADDAQDAAAYGSLMQNILKFLCSTIIGSISDTKGRRLFLLAGIFLNILPSICLVFLQMLPTMNPYWYYFFNSLNGVVDWSPITFSIMADLMPSNAKSWRAAGFGHLIIAKFSATAFVPSLAIFLSHLKVSIISVAFGISALAHGYYFIPETLLLTKTKNLNNNNNNDSHDSIGGEESKGNKNPNSLQTQKLSFFQDILLRPFHEMSILNRNSYLRLLTFLSFASGMVISGEHTFRIYYVVNHLSFNDKDIAFFFAFNGALAMFVQGYLVKRGVEMFGERKVIIIAFFFGFTHCIQLSTSKTKFTMLLACVGAKLTGMAFPTLSSMKTFSVDENERGRIQGAFFSLSALADAVGPISMQFIYNRTKEDKDGGGGLLNGPGTMFLFAGLLYLFGFVAAFWIPLSRSKVPDDSTETKQKI